MSIRELETRLNETKERSGQLFQQIMAITRQQISRDLFPIDVTDRISELMDQRRVLTEEAARITTQLNDLRSRPRSRSRSRSNPRSRHENSRPDTQASAHAFMLAAQAGLHARQVPQGAMRAAQERMRAAQASSQGAMRAAQATQERMRAAQGAHAVKVSFASKVKSDRR